MNKPKNLDSMQTAIVMTEPIELWKSIPHFPDYLVSNLGNVRSLYRGKDKLLKLSPNKRYLQVTLKGESKRTNKLVHRLVMLAFVGPRPNNMGVRHLDGNPLNNCLKNLAYGTHKENMDDMRLHGTHFMANKTECKWGHLFDQENTYIYKTQTGGVGRGCKICRRERAKIYVLSGKRPPRNEKYREKHRLADAKYRKSEGYKERHRLNAARYREKMRAIQVA